MLVNRAGKWRTIAQRWDQEGSRLSFLVVQPREARLVLATLEQYGWWLDRFAVSDVIAESTSDTQRDTGQDCYYHLLFRKAER